MKKKHIFAAAALTTLALCSVSAFADTIPTATSTSTQTTVTYQIRPGDTLYLLAQANHISLASLEQANPQITNVSDVTVGQTIYIPAATSSDNATTAPAAAAAPTTAANSTPSALAYQIQPGDTLYLLAQTKHISLASLEQANPQITNVSDIAVGQTIYIPVTAASSTTATTATQTAKTAQAATSGTAVTSPAPALPPATPVTTTSAASTTTAQTPAQSGTQQASNILSLAQSLVGTHYQWGGDTPQTGFDCSGFVYYVYQQNGVQLPRTAHEQATVGTSVSQSQLQPGDLLFFTDTDAYASDYANQVTHVGIYIGNGAMIESSSSHNGEGVVVVQNVFSNPYYTSHYYGARNVLGN